MKTKKVIAMTALAAVLTATAIAAEPSYSISAGGKTVTTDVHTDGDVVMIPLRKVCEDLGYTVEWNGEARRVELRRGAHYITLHIGEDRYSFAKMGPIKLGTAPKLGENGITYVPVSFVSEVLQSDYIIKNGTIILDPAINAIITEIGDKTITVNDDENGTVVLNIGDDTVLEDEGGNPLKLSDFKSGAAVSVIYSEVMTSSLPPQNTPVKVTLLSEAITLPDVSGEKPVYVGSGAVVTESDGKTITVWDSEMGTVVLNIGENTALLNEKGEKADISDFKKDTQVTVEYSDAMTMSLPPQNTPVSITLNPSGTVTAGDDKKGIVIGSETSAVITEADGDVILVKEDGGRNVELHIGDDTLLLAADGSKAALSDFKSGAAVLVEYSPAMTKSLPPQNTPVSIRLVK